MSIYNLYKCILNDDGYCEKDEDNYCPNNRCEEEDYYNNAIYIASTL